MMASHHKSQELLKLLNILREYDSNRQRKLKTKLQGINETYNKSTDEQQGAIDSRTIPPHLFDSINDHRDEIDEQGTQLNM